MVEIRAAVFRRRTRAWTREWTGWKTNRDHDCQENGAEKGPSDDVTTSATSFQRTPSV